MIDNHIFEESVNDAASRIANAIAPTETTEGDSLAEAVGILTEALNNRLYGTARASEEIASALYFVGRSIEKLAQAVEGHE